MSRLRFAGIVAAFALAGCGGEDSGVTEGTVPFKTGNVEQLAPLKNQMTEAAKSKAYLKRPTGESKPATEGKPAGDIKVEEKKP
ncbi:MAG: hypothetical protein ACLQIB_38540 [Isosphaeraceae bacterium]